MIVAKKEEFLYKLRLLVTENFDLFFFQSNDHPKSPVSEPGFLFKT
jgi:hypothetical protein